MKEPGFATAGRATYAPRRVPEAYVRAEIAAFPLASKEAFEVHLTELDPALGDGERRRLSERIDDPERISDPTARVWRACERSLVEHASGWSLDRLVGVRDRTWFEQDGAPRAFGVGSAGPLPPGVPMDRYVRHLATTHLAIQRGTTDVYVDLNKSALDAILHYRWLQFALPEDLLLAALPIDPPPTRVEHENTLMVRGLLDRGVAEIHLHGGAGVPFRMLWAAGLARLADPSLRTSEAIGPDFPIGDTGDEWLRWLLVAAIARIALAEFLVEATRGEKRDLKDLRFNHYLQDTGGIDLPGLQHYCYFVLRDAIAALGQLDSRLPKFEQLQYLYARLHPSRRLGLEPPKTADELWKWCDPVAARLNLSREGAGERWLIRQGFWYLERRRECGAGRDLWFETTFWQMIRLRCLCYRHIVQRPLTAGLQWFIRFYERIHELSPPLSRLRPEAILKLAGSEKRLAALEMRMSMEEWATDIAKKLLDTLESWKHVVERDYGGRFDPPELGVLVHFIKERDSRELWSQGRPQAFGAGTHAEPNPRVDGRHRLASAKTVRFGQFVAENARRAGALAELLHAVPRVLWLLRGIDVASDELGVPTWVLAPLYSYLRQEAAYASALPEARGAPTLRTTAHVGEDYRHLLEGLRRVFEAVVYLLDRKGSRLGHALALGVEPRLWAESVGTVLVPKEERLWDLVFEWRLYTRSDIPPEFIAEAPSGRIPRVAHHIEELAYQIYDRSDIQAADLAHLYHDLHSFMSPRAGGASGYVDIEVADIAVEAGLQRYCSRSVHGNRARYRWLLQQYLSDPGVFHRGQELMEVPIDSGEIEALQVVQNTLRCAVAARSIVVEVNPTSNLLIGDMLDLRSHPILRLFPIEPESGVPAVAIAIGSDDPVTFSTTLVREYGLLYHAAREAGYPERAVQTWLDLVRQTSLDGRFTLPWRPSVEKMMEDLSEELSRYLHLPRKAPPKREVLSASIR